MLYRRSCAIDGALMAWDCRNLRGERAARTLAQISRNLCGVMWLRSDFCLRLLIDRHHQCAGPATV